MFLIVVSSFELFPPRLFGYFLLYYKYFVYKYFL